MASGEAAETGGLVEAAASGDRLTGLRAARDFLAVELLNCESSSAKAALMARFVEVLEQIEALAPPAVKKETTLDEIGERRRVRGAASPGVSRSRGSRSGGR